MTVRHRGGGSRRKLRIIDFKRDKIGVAAEVLAIEYDPNRSAYIALVQYPEEEKRYILAPLGLAVGQSVMSGPDAEVRVGNALPIGQIPVGTHDPQHRAAARQGGPDRPERRVFGADCGTGGQIHPRETTVR